MRTGKIKNMVTGEVINVVATTNHPDSHYGKAVWVDEDNVAYMEVDFKIPNPFYEVIEDSGKEPSK